MRDAVGEQLAQVREAQAHRITCDPGLRQRAASTTSDGGHARERIADNTRAAASRRRPHAMSIRACSNSFRAGRVRVLATRRT
jgi:hypothetical protein